MCKFSLFNVQVGRLAFSRGWFCIFCLNFYSKFMIKLLLVWFLECVEMVYLNLKGVSLIGYDFEIWKIIMFLEYIFR